MTLYMIGMMMIVMYAGKSFFDLSESVEGHDGV